MSKCSFSKNGFLDHLVSEAGVVDDSEKTTTISELMTPKSYRDLKCYYHWPSVKKDVATFLSQCQTCVRWLRLSIRCLVGYYKTCHCHSGNGT